MNIVNFLKEVEADHKGRCFQEILLRDDFWLENNHDWIQWVFPLTVPSKSMPRAPFLTSDDVLTIKDSCVAQNNLRKALQRMNDFYQLNNHWLVPHNHNHARITRILKSTKLLLSKEESDNFLQKIINCIQEPEIINSCSVSYWID